MKTYLAYKNQIQGFTDVAETVKTVEKIAASSVHFLKQEVINLNIYADEIKKALSRMSLFYLKKDNPLLQKRVSKTKTLIILTGKKGLVGGLWHKVIGAFLENINQYQSIIVVGVKGKNYLKEENVRIIKSFINIFDGAQKEEIKHITNYIFNEFRKKTFSQVDILYPRFISLAEQEPVFISFLPFEFRLGKDNESGIGFPIFEPSKKRVFDQLLQKYIKIFFHKIIMETKLSELSARTVAMEHACIKTNEFIQKFTLNYLKERRRIATEKQLESFTAHKSIKNLCK